MTEFIQPVNPHDEYASEPIPGLPAQLPEGERILWQGSPSWSGLAVQAFHVRKVAIYFAALMTWRVAEVRMAGGGWEIALAKAAGLLPLALAGVTILLLLAYLYARSAIYTITSRRVVIRSGVALPITLNLPFKRIDGAGLKLRADGSGDLPLKPSQDDRVPLMACWPNNRPWRWSKPEPMLRSVPDAARVAEILAAALAGAPVPAAASTAVVTGTNAAVPAAG